MSDRRAYTLGRLLAALDHLGHIPDAERHYELTCRDPHALAAPLNRATAASETNRDYLAPLIEALPRVGDPFAGPLGEEASADFALGYYHQRHDIRRGVTPEYDGDLTAPEAALLLGITKQALHAAIESGRLPARRVGERKTLLHRSDVERYAETRKPRPPRPEPTVQ